MSTPETITSEIQKLEPSAVIELFELDLTDLGDTVYRFHAGTNGLRANVVWQGETYTAFPIEIEGFEIAGNGQLPRPKIRVANVTGAITLLALTYGDLIGAKVTRKRTLKKYLDEANFPTRRNLLLNTENFSAASWVPLTGGVASAPVVTANAGLGPDGTMTADRIVFALNGGTTSTDQSTIGQSITTTAGQPYAASLWIRTEDGSEKTIRLDFNGTSGSSPTHTVTGEWTRITNVLTSAADTSRFPRLRLRGGTGTSDSGTFLVWGAQFENDDAVSDYQAIGSSFSRNPDADPTAEFADDVFYIDRKSVENRDVVEFELSASFDVAGVQLPKRQVIQNVCPWRYKGTECGYAGTSYFDANDGPVSSSSRDVCGKRLSSCQARFGENGELPFGGFPAAGLTR